MIRVSVIGASGYAGCELVRLLAGHPDVTIVRLASHSQVGEHIQSMYPGLASLNLPAFSEILPDEMALESDVVFTSMPHGNDAVISALCKYTKVIDLSGDYRYLDVQVYEKWYQVPHGNPELLKQSVYGMPELHREQIKGARLVGNPGCYTTCSILALAPLVKMGLADSSSFIINALSGATGAGRGLTTDTHFCELNQNAKAYKIAAHRHTSEIEQELSLLAGKSLKVSFTPHLVPLNRGILATCYANLLPGVTALQVENAYRTFFASEPFVRLQKQPPEIKHVVGSNFLDIGWVLDARLNRLVVVAALDNLIKGAAGQAVQNMNLMFSLPETAGLPVAAWNI